MLVLYSLILNCVVRDEESESETETGSAAARVLARDENRYVINSEKVRRLTVCADHNDCSLFESIAQ